MNPAPPQAHGLIRQVGGLIKQVGGLIRQAGALIREVGGLIRQVGGLITQVSLGQVTPRCFSQPDRSYLIELADDNVLHSLLIFSFLNVIV